MFVTHFINTMFNANTRVQCGTSVPIWLKGTHPSVSDGIQTRQACANFETEDTSHIPCCAQAINIGVKNCNGFFVYFLHPPPICPVAYCAGKEQPCPPGQWSDTGFPPGCKEAYPQLTHPPTLLGPIIDGDTFYFTCDITFNGNDLDQAFEFVWLFDGVENDTTVPPEIVSYSTRSARLDGSKLKGLLNKNIGCKVRAFYKVFKQNSNKVGPWMESPRTYWAGIKTEPTHIYLPTDEDRKEVVIKSTLPVLCNSSSTNHPNMCCIWVNLLVEGHQVGGDRLLVSNDCRYTLCRFDWDNKLQEMSTSFTIEARYLQIQDGNKDLLVSFSSLTIADPSPYMKVFSGLQIPSVQVYLEQRDSKLCQMVTDPHITGLEDKRQFHLLNVGDYTAYENIRRDFECRNCRERQRSGFIGWQPTSGKRSANGGLYIDSDEVNSVYDPSRYADFQPPTLSLATSTGISESQAENYLLHRLETRFRRLEHTG
ncbi:hypothetical protein C0Q70_20817 [Pomacea canaliculata]|uniref:UMOD/GP2/OIT3-like D8C domain-containing protein n=1 Tax=Pomacea canaliculata TaxID=400727 RepID=A0A2T7NAS8_POMCA|nr:hypothetical protein C0Q70_20817 [Pomacea canaliculata]